MKRLIAIGLFVNAALLAGVLLKKEVVVQAAGRGGGVPVGNGDVNGDGAIDLSDAVYTLNWLFIAGPAPVAIECPPPFGKGLPATGQTKCYGNVEGNWTEVPCDQADCKGQDGQYSAGCPSEGRFVDNGDGTLTDHCTGLMWQRVTADGNGDGQFSAELDYLSWCDALAYCENLSLGGGLVAWDDWRLPNVRELQSIVDYGRGGPANDRVFQTCEGVYWSSSPAGPELAWTIDFAGGSVSYNKKDQRWCVRVVRNAP